MSLDDPTDQMRWYIGLAAIFFAIAPIGGMALVASGSEAGNAWVPVLVGAPINLAGVVFAVLSMTTRVPRAASIRLATACALVLLGDTALYGINALIS
ncbi:hypothetical protein [Actinoplanes couchii]|uniref:Integral membrane protein n=1 Tax=Actinoplanes couchii TaxID=403638 RepID=A0ABQ3X1U4_9ACTN|nr:hypothetical protein [Actinoplanes couchii]MDR6316844.1 hypothetical protein [Actinoplanes couchii]GID52451.1 hypothetical protein Aco03nite_008550 [Actinoplanes couchii]